MTETIETLLAQWKEGDRQAGERVMALAYGELRRLAAYYFRQELSGHTLQPTAVVHEVFLKLSAGATIPWRDRAHFFAVAARQMRRILIDHARRRKALKRADTNIIFAVGNENRADRGEDVLVVDEALQNLEKLDERAARVTELRVFGGLKETEIAAVLGISTATVKRDWTFAKAWLVTRLRGI